MKKRARSASQQPLSLQQIAQQPQVPDQTERWELRLYVAGQSPRSVFASANLKKLCDEYLKGRYTIEVVDLIQAPHLAASDQIVAIPTLVRKLPQPLRKIIGDLRDQERVLVSLQVKPGSASTQISE